ncbi:hypothetical protein P24_04699 [Oceanibaculum indicum P24]|uniref:DUF192 domain-containing protein n=2 Tax=Oceanibaculum indicum TaxID=526216 RepID=K2JQT5_9PROT|nr:hypothetical protein P24_04699 [Oceanibaculum indicum P24]
MRKFFLPMPVLLLVMALWTGDAVAQGAASFERSGLIIETAQGQQHRFDVEMAVTPAQQAQGLMFRQQMAPEAGMLFLYDRPQGVAMWMKNTLIPLDMFFIDAKGRITGIEERTVPFSTQTIESPGLASAVLELNAGTAERLGIRVGDRLVHPAFR